MRHRKGIDGIQQFLLFANLLLIVTLLFSKANRKFYYCMMLISNKLSVLFHMQNGVPFYSFAQTRSYFNL